MDKFLNIMTIGLDIQYANKEANIKSVEKQLELMPEGIDLVVLPEMFSTGFITKDKNAILELSEKNIDDTITHLQKFSERYKVAIAGTFLARTNISTYNRAFFIEPSGDVTYYDKRHLFSLAHENDNYKAGEKLPPIIRYRGWNIMPIICYDLRFPVWCRNDNRKYDLLLIMANWPSSRAYAWEHLIIARAIENQCYVCAVNRTGEDNNGFGYNESQSIILDYEGKPIAHKLNNTSLVATLSEEKYDKYVKRFAFWKDADNFKIENDDILSFHS